MPSSTRLTDLLAEMRDLDAIQRGEISARAIADRAFVVAPGFVVPRGYQRDNIDPAAAEEAWEEGCDSSEFLDWYSQFVPPPPPPPEPDPEPEPAPAPDRGPRGIFRAMRRRLAR